MKNNPVPFSETSLGDSLVLSVNDTILQTSAAVDAHRMARSLYGQTVGVSTVEFYAYSPNALTPALTPSGGVPPITEGIVNGSAAFNKYVGEDANGFGYCRGDGNVYNNGSSVASFATSALNDYVEVTLDEVNLNASWWKNGVLLGTVTITADAWWYAATVSGNPGDLAIWANAGQTPFKYPNSAGGWYHLAEGLDPIYLATEPYLSAAADAIPNQKYIGAVDRTQSPMQVTRVVTFWPWGTSMPSQLSGGNQIQIDITDPHEQFGELLSLDIRDQLVVVSRLYAGAAFSTAEAIVTAIIDHCEQTSDQTKTLYCNDKLVQLQTQPYRALFAPNVDPSVAGKPYPLTSGIARTFVGSLFDSTTNAIQLADEAISAFGKMRIQGVEGAYGVDYITTPDAAGATLSVTPPGKVTWEITTFGGEFDATLTDLLSGDGEFGSTADDGGVLTGTSTTSITIGTGTKVFTIASPSTHSFANGSTIHAVNGANSMTGTVAGYNSSTGALTISVASVVGSGTFASWNMSGGLNQPHNWGHAAGGYPTSAQNTIWQVRGTAPNQYVEISQVASADFSMQSLTYTVPAGGAVAYEVVVKQAPYFGPGIDVNNNPVAIPPAQLCFSPQPSHNLPFYAWVTFPIPTAGTYRGSFVNTSSSNQALNFGFLANNMIQGTGGITSLLQITSIILVALPDLTQNDILDGPGLDLILQDLMIQHGPMTLDDYDATGAQAIDAATGYKYGIHVGSNETPQVSDIVKLVRDSACVDNYINRSGDIATIQLTPPEDATVIAGSLTTNDIQGYLEPYPDNAENLTTRMSGCKNYDPYTESDFSTTTQSTVPQIVRKQLEQDFQWTVTANAVLSSKYQVFAINANPLPSQFDREADGQAEITRVCSMYAKPRNFYVGDFFRRVGSDFELGEIYNVTYPLATLENGQQLMVVGVVDSPTEELVTLVFWGL